MPGSHTTKKSGSSIRKINNDFQKNLIKGYVSKISEKQNDFSNVELSTRTPGKTNPELSPYVMDFYKKRQTLYKDSLAAKIRSSGNQIKFKNSVKEYHNNSATKEKSLLPKHKKSKSQTAIMGINYEKHHGTHEVQEESTYTTQIKVNTKRAIKRQSEKRKSIQNDDNNIKVDIGLRYQINNRSKCNSKKKTTKIFWTKDSHDFSTSEMHQQNTFRENGSQHDNQRGSVLEKALYDRYSSATNSKTSLKVKGNNNAIQRQLKSRVAKAIYNKVGRK